jgi:hypothetical protein
MKPREIRGQPGRSKRPKPTPRRGRLLLRSSGPGTRRWQPSPRSLKLAACGPLQGATVGTPSKSPGCWQRSPRAPSGRKCLLAGLPPRPRDSATPATLATVGVVRLIGAGPCIPIEMSQPVLRNQFHPPTAGRSKTGKPEPGTPTLPAGVSRLGWIEDAIGWPTLVAPRADVVVGAMARPALRPVRKWREADAPPSPPGRLGSQCRCRD